MLSMPASRTVEAKARRVVYEYDHKMIGNGDYTLMEKANEELAAMLKEQATETLGKVLQTASEHMKNGYSRADH